MADFRAAIERFRGGAAGVVLGGQQAPEIVLDRGPENVEVSVTANGNDPWPLLRFLIWHERAG